MRTITDLLSSNGRGYVYLASKELAEQFLSHAEAEGFTYGDGVDPTKRHTSDIFALNSNRTINYVGWAGHMAFHHPDKVMGQKLIRIDYGRYISGKKQYVIK